MQGYGQADADAREKQWRVLIARFGHAQRQPSFSSGMFIVSRAPKLTHQGAKPLLTYARSETQIIG